MYTKDELLEFIDLLANGIDPKTGEVMEKDSVLNRPDIIRMLYSLKEYMLKSTIKIPRSERTEFVLSSIEGIIENGATISSFTKRINEVNCDEKMKPLNYKIIYDWLLQEGYLQLLEGENKRVPTDKGINLGLSKTIRRTQYGIPYSVVVFNNHAQEFLLEKLANGEIDSTIKLTKNEE